VQGECVGIRLAIFEKGGIGMTVPFSVSIRQNVEKCKKATKVFPKNSDKYIDNVVKVV
jgi:hypothetical protein